MEVYGSIVSTGLDFASGNLIVNDTLVVFGDLVLADTLDLTISSGGILIVRGDFTAGDTVDIWNSGTMVVTGTCTLLGDNDQGSFDNDGKLYFFDGGTGLKDGTGYEDFTCGNPVDSCSIYDESDLLASPLGAFYSSGSYEIVLSGSSSFCLGDSAELSVVDTATNYRWFRDDSEIPGATA